jgi:hypothetical protein
MKLDYRTVALLAFAVGCSTGPSGPILRVAVGPDGLSSHGDNISFEIPAGALASQTTITVTTIKDHVPIGLTALSPIYRFEALSR